MKISRNWLQTFFDNDLPSNEKIAEGLTFHSFEIEEVVKKDKDTIFDIKVLPNRAHDCLCHLGIAREISAIFELPLKNDSLRVEIKDINNTEKFALNIESKKVKRFKAVLINGIEVKESPNWLRERIESMGGRSINNIVDITNFVMFEIGEPMHAFDANKILGEKKSFTVRESKSGEKIKTLDGIDRELTDGNILITDGADSSILLGIAGVKGGAHAEITNETKNIILEAATFDAETIRKTSKLLGIRTDASVRFENGLASELPDYAIQMALSLIEKEAKEEGFVVEGCADFNLKPKKPYKIGVSLNEVNKILGTEINDESLKTILTRLGFRYEFKTDIFNTISGEACKLLGVPYVFGASVTADAPKCFDCSSFSAYLYQNVGIPIPRISVDQYAYGEQVEIENALPGDLIFSNTNVGKVHFETIEFMKGLKVDVGVDHVGVYIGNGEVVHANGITGNVIREKIEESERFKNFVGIRSFRMFDDNRYVVELPFERLDIRSVEDLVEEVGRLYGLGHIPSIKPDIPDLVEDNIDINDDFYKAEAVRNSLIKLGYSEVYTYAMVNDGEVEIENPIASDKSFMRANITSGIEKALELNYRNMPLLGESEIKIFEIGSVFKKDKEEIFVCVAEKNGKKKSVVEYSLNDALSKFSGESPIEVRNKIISNTGKYKAVSVYPFALRDIALWVPENLSSDSVLNIIKENSGEYLVRSDLFDTYKKDGKVSYAYHLVFQAMDKTLTEEEINSQMEKIVSALKANSFEIR